VASKISPTSGNAAADSASANVEMFSVYDFQVGGKSAKLIPA
jgi:hypothetical protein